MTEIARQDFEPETLRVLHVEDSPSYAQLVDRVLAASSTPFALTLVGTLAEARERLTIGPPPQLVLLDLRLPDGDGLELLAWLRERRLATAVVVLTGDDDRDHAVAALHAGADDYVVKGEVALARLGATLVAARERHLDVVRRRGRRLNVLYAEHHQADIDLTRRHLMRYAPHIRLAVVADAATVLQRLPATADANCSFDLVLLDYRLPGMDALELVKRLRADRGLRVPIVLVSGQGSEDVATRAIHLGADDYLTKHAGYLRELPATLERVHRQAELAREQRRLTEATERLTLMMSASPVVLYSRGSGVPPPPIDWVSVNLPRLLGFSEAQVKAPDWWTGRLHADDRERVLVELGELESRGSLRLDYRFIDGWGRIRWVQEELRLMRGTERYDPVRRDDASGLSQAVVGAWSDNTEVKESQARRQARLGMLDRLLEGDSLPRLLGRLAEQLEQIRPELRVCIRLVDPETGLLRNAIAPSLPKDLLETFDRVIREPGRRAPWKLRPDGTVSVVDDIALDPDWACCAEAVARAGLTACWAVPFHDDAGGRSGLFSVFLAEPLEPLEADLDLLREFARLARLALRRVRDAEDQREAATLFRSVREGVAIIDVRWRIIAINPALAALLGAGYRELGGQDIERVLSEPVSPVWRQVVERQLGDEGRWQGRVQVRRTDGQCSPAGLELVRVDDPEGRAQRYIGTIHASGGFEADPAPLYDPRTALPGRELAIALVRQALRCARARRQGMVLLLLRVRPQAEAREPLPGLLVRAAGLLQRHLPEDALLAHAGDDALLVLLEDPLPGKASPPMEAGLSSALASLSTVAGEGLAAVSVGLGRACYPADADNAEALLRQADAAARGTAGDGA